MATAVRQKSNPSQQGPRRRVFHWESWLLRLVLLATLVFQVVMHNRPGATVAAEGVVATLVPLAVERFSRVHVPRPVEFIAVLVMVLQFTSESLKLFEIFFYWDKIVHPGEIALCTMLFVFFLLGFRDRFHERMPTTLAAAIGLMAGAFLGAFWEFVEFTSDWFGNTDLQKSNADTITDLMSNDIGALLATAAAAWLYSHYLSDEQRRQCGELGRWLAGGVGRLLNRHGRVVATAAFTIVALIIGAALFVDRNPPALAAGAPAGSSGSWKFAPANSGPTMVLAGKWQNNERGICRVNAPQPAPGSEKMGLLELAPGSAYGASQPFRVETRLYEERPPKIQGTQMDGGIAFGIRDADNFYLLESSALHDILRLDRFIHGKRRDVREKLYRTRGNEWHDLRLDVNGGAVTAYIDGRAIYTVTGLPDTAGGVGLWARATATTCFDGANITTGPGATASVPVPGRVLMD